MVPAAEIKIWDKIVGILAWEEKQQYGLFQWNEKWISQGLEVAPILSPNRDIDPQQTYSFVPGSPVDYETFKGLPPFIADSLPDSFGNKVINAWLQKQHRNPNSFTPIERLCYTGKRGVGALDFFPAMFKNDKVVDVDIVGLVNLAQTVFSEREKLQTNISKEGEAIMNIVRVGASAGGARPKAVIAYNEITGDIKSGQVAELPAGFEHWLIKFDGVTKSSELGLASGMGRVEYAYHRMAVDCGITLA